MYAFLLVFVFAAVVCGAKPAGCPNYKDYSTEIHQPVSAGKYQLSYQRPDPSCRTFFLAEVEQAIADMRQTVKDPDLFRLFENSFPNTLDTTISWKGFASGNPDEEVRLPKRDLGHAWF
jgi:uncharacterized protein